MFSPLHRLGPPPRCEFRLVCNGSHNSARTAIRFRLCGPNTFSPFQSLHLFRKNALFYFTQAVFLSVQAWRLRNSLKIDPPMPVLSKHASARPFLACLLSLFRYNELVCSLWPCFTAPKRCLAVFCKKRDPLTPARSKHAFAPSVFLFFPRKCVFLTAREPFF